MMRITIRKERRKRGHLLPIVGIRRKAHHILHQRHTHQHRQVLLATPKHPPGQIQSLLSKDNHQRDEIENLFVLALEIKGGGERKTIKKTRIIGTFTLVIRVGGRSIIRRRAITGTEIAPRTPTVLALRSQ